MQKLLLILLLFFLNISVNAQQIINDSIVHDGLQRTYILYVPSTYTGEPAPLVLNLHGYTSSAFEQMFYGNFRPVADTAGFILVHPNGTNDPNGNAYWNAEFGGDVDDIGFLESLIDSLALDYNIDMERVYSTGMSNGGFMSYTLACNINNRIAAVASVTGTMLDIQLTTCSPEHPTPVMEIHGTSDFVVPYNGNAFWASTPQVIDYWVNYNQCNVTPLLTDIPDLDPDDGCTAHRYDYVNGVSGSSVVHYKIDGGGHTWPGSIINTGNGNTNQDFNACVAIWDFFNAYSLDGLSTGNEVFIKDFSFNVSPNPANNSISVTMEKEGLYEMTIFDYQGRLVLLTSSHNKTFEGDLMSATPGIYFIMVRDIESNRMAVQKLIVQ